MFRRGISAYPALDDGLALRKPRRDRSGLCPPGRRAVAIGNLRHDAALPAYLATDALLGKNLAILGSTGSGKSCAVTVVLLGPARSHPFAHMLVLDPHNEYAAAFGDRALRLDPANLELPYWLLTFEEIAVVLTRGGEGRGYGEGAILRDAILRAKQLYRRCRRRDRPHHRRHAGPLPAVGPRAG